MPLQSWSADGVVLPCAAVTIATSCPSTSRSPSRSVVANVELPAGLTMSPQAATSWSGATGAYQSSWQLAARRLVLERRSEVRMDEVPAAQWAEARALLQAMYTGDNAPVILKGP